MKRLVIVIIFAIFLVGLVLLGLADKDISIADTGVPNNEIASSVNSNSSATATITITMTGVFGQ